MVSVTMLSSTGSDPNLYTARWGQVVYVLTSCTWYADQHDDSQSPWVLQASTTDHCGNNTEIWIGCRALCYMLWDHQNSTMQL